MKREDYCFKKTLAQESLTTSGAEDEIRTRDILLGKEAFYH
jgi:hypothetical protein